MNRGWKILGACVGVAALGAVALAVWIKSVESRRWTEMERTLRGLVQEAASRPSDRPPLRGEPLPGNAWEDYDRALCSMKDLGTPTGLMQAEVPAALFVLKRQAPTIDVLRSAVRRAEATARIDFEKQDRGNNLLFKSFVHLLVREALERGRPGEAVRLLLDASRVAADAGANSEFIGGLVSNECQALVLDSLKEVVLRQSMTPEEFRDIARQLDLLDRSLPQFGVILVNGVTCSGWDMYHAGSVLDSLRFFEPLYPQGMPGVSRWRFAFSDRLMLKDAFERELAWSRKIAQADARSWADADRIIRQVDAERAASSNGILRIAGRWMSADGYYSLGASLRERRAQMRLLRGAALFRAGDGVPDGDDPFDGKLYRQEAEGRLKIWSVGRNAVNDGGSGAWTQKEGKDIVLEVTR